MAITGIPSTSNVLSAYYNQKNHQLTPKTKGTEELENDKTDKKENDKLAMRMLAAGTKMEATGAYWGSLQESIRDSKDGFEAYRRTSKLMATHDKIAESKEYESKSETDSLVKDLVDAMDENKANIDELVKKREEDTKDTEDTEALIENTVETKEEDKTNNNDLKNEVKYI